MKELMINKTILDELVNGILEIFQNDILAVLLYGSVAKGTATEESDVDIALILKKAPSSYQEEKLNDFVVDMNLKYDKVFSVIDVEDAVMQKWQNSIPFYRDLEKEGITLWKAA